MLARLQQLHLFTIEWRDFPQTKCHKITLSQRSVVHGVGIPVQLALAYLRIFSHKGFPDIVILKISKYYQVSIEIVNKCDYCIRTFFAANFC